MNPGPLTLLSWCKNFWMLYSRKCFLSKICEANVPGTHSSEASLQKGQLREEIKLPKKRRIQTILREAVSSQLRSWFCEEASFLLTGHLSIHPGEVHSFIKELVTSQATSIKPVSSTINIWLNYQTLSLYCQPGHSCSCAEASPRTMRRGRINILMREAEPFLNFSPRGNIYKLQTVLILSKS